MDGQNNGSKPYEQMDDLGGFPPIFGNTHIYIYKPLIATIASRVGGLDPMYGISTCIYRKNQPNVGKYYQTLILRLMEEILHHLECIQPCK